MAKFHEPVLLKEVVRYLVISKGEKYIDATAGGGGHSELILKSGGKILAIDCDPEALEAARSRLASACPLGDEFSWRLARGNFKDLGKMAKRYGFTEVAGILFDLGVSFYQLKTPERGFSFNTEAPLDMRMDPALTVTAADLVNGLGKGELDELLAKFGQEYHSRRIANAICCARRIKPIKTCKELAEIIVKAKSRRGGLGRIHPATRCFLALRMAVNDELNSLEKALPQAAGLLKPGGKLVVISFHSGEDGIVKRFFRELEKEKTLRIITKKPVRPSAEEIKRNPRSRSAKLRVGEKCHQVKDKENLN